jgi:hypothetical protein
MAIQTPEPSIRLNASTVARVSAVPRGLSPEGRLDESWIPEIPASKVLVESEGLATYDNLQEVHDLTRSAGHLDGGEITVGTPSTSVAVAAGQGFIRAMDDDTSRLYTFDWTAPADIAIPTDSLRFIRVDYNGGAPLVTASAVEDYDYRTGFPLGFVINEAGTLYINNTPHSSGRIAGRLARRNYEVEGRSRAHQLGGLILSETGTRKVAVSAGVTWLRGLREAFPGLDTNVAGTFDRYYRDGSGGWTIEAGATQTPNDNWDDGTGVLNDLLPNQYATRWFYLGSSNSVAMLYGRAEHVNLANAEDEPAPNSLPPRLQTGALLLGRMVIQKGAAASSLVSTAFETTFSQLGVTDHSDLTGLTTGDDHTQYQLRTEKDAADGYAVLTATRALKVHSDTSLLDTSFNVLEFGGVGGPHFLRWDFDGAILQLDIGSGVFSLTGDLDVTGTILEGTWNGSFIGADYGGTGLSSYTTGDLLYASAATTLSKLAGVATGNALLSGGVATAPVWGKVGLTTHVSGTLAVANGGTGATTFTAGRILFGNTASAINTDADLFWNNTNKWIDGLTIGGTVTRSFSGGNVSSALFINPDKELVDDTFDILRFGRDDAEEYSGFPGGITWNHSTGRLEFHDGASKLNIHTGYVYADGYVFAPRIGAGHTGTPLAGLTVKQTGSGYVNVGQLAGNSNYCGIAFGTHAAVTTANYAILGGDGNTFLNVPTSGSIFFRVNNATKMTMDTNGRFGIGVSPSSYLHLPAGIATAGFAPLKFTSGTNLTVAEAGALEYNGRWWMTETGNARRSVVLATGEDEGGAYTVAGAIEVVINGAQYWLTYTTI